jgi:protoporphyrinogen oxidase
MKNPYGKVRTRFGREVRFDVAPTPFRAAETTQLDNLKDRLLRQFLDQTNDPGQNTALRRAANDAVALAWVTQYPLLVFPTLLEEKARAALLQAERQARIRARSHNLLKAA